MEVYRNLIDLQKKFASSIICWYLIDITIGVSENIVSGQPYLRIYSPYHKMTDTDNYRGHIHSYDCLFT